MRSSTNAETPQQPELTSDDSLRFSREASKYGQEVHGDQCPGSVYHAFRDGAKYATLHERAAAQARIKELEDRLANMVKLVKDEVIDDPFGMVPLYLKQLASLVVFINETE